jgi:hypothetical protein
MTLTELVASGNLEVLIVEKKFLLAAKVRSPPLG